MYHPQKTRLGLPTHQTCHAAQRMPRSAQQPQLDRRTRQFICASIPG